MQRHVALAPLTTLGIGGPAKFFVEARSVDAVRDAVDWAKSNGEPLLVLAGGSNVLIADEGFNGLVLHLDLRGMNVEKNGTVKAAASEPWDQLVATAVAKNLAGVECLSGIPGSTGATPIQNVGAYGQDVSETIVAVDVYDRATGRLTSLSNADCRFEYRDSIFKHEARDRYIVLSVTFQLRPDGPPLLRYPELQDFAGDDADLQQVRDAVIAIRRRKGMVIDPADTDTRSDGSFFMNPIVSADKLAQLGEMPHFPAGGKIKLSAAWLIEHAGFHKGFVHGNVGISSKHTLAIINRGGGTAREVLELARMIQDRVHEKFGVELQPEPNFIGFDRTPDRTPA
ncbi:MAG: UDP-N-acetylenolpyruvoylglucosamine reductase [Acidobacteria bacterium]|nr:MAG: UDP-N-acetylenolpyruvoylglucosamine reductase [Acidobacteriota bacterium]